MKARRYFFPLMVVVASYTSNAFAADGTWFTSDGGNWEDTGKWVGGALANGENATADFSQVNIVGTVNVRVNESQTVGHLVFADQDTSTGGSWLLNGSSIALSGTSASVQVGSLADNQMVTIESQLTGSSGLIKLGAGTLRLNHSSNQYSGDTVVQQGLLIANAPGDYQMILNPSSAITIQSGAEMRVTGGINAFNRTKNDAPVNILGGIFDYQGSTHGHMGHVVLGDGGTLKATTGGGYHSENMALHGDITVINSESNTQASRIASFSQGLGLDGERTFTVHNISRDDATDLFVAAELEDASNSQGKLVKTGGGTMVLENKNTYSNGTLIQDGILVLDNKTNNGDTRIQGQVTIQAQGTLRTTGDNNNSTGLGWNGQITGIVIDGGLLDIATGSSSHVWGIRDGIRMIGGRIQSNGGQATSTGSLMAWNHTTVTVDPSDRESSISGGIHIRGDSNYPGPTFNVQDGPATRDLVVNAIIGEATTNRSLTKEGAGEMVMTANSTYTGGTIVNAGTLTLAGGGNGNGTVRGTITVNPGATLKLASADATGYNTDGPQVREIRLTDATMHVATGAGNGQNQTLGNTAVHLTGSHITAAAVTSNMDFFRGDSTLISHASANSSVIDPMRLQIRQDKLNIVVEEGEAADDLVIQGVIYGGSLVKQGAGTLVLTAANTYTGATTIEGGTLCLRDQGSLGTTTSVTLAAGTTLEASATGFTLADGVPMVAGKTEGTQADLVGDFAIHGPLNIARTGAIGTLRVDGDLTLGSTVSIDRDASNGDSDRIIMTGALTIAPGFQVSVNTVGVPNANAKSYVIATGFTSITGTENLPPLPPGYEWDTSEAGSLKVNYQLQGTSLVWTGAVTNEWDFETNNWSNGQSPASYQDGDLVTFNDTSNVTNVILPVDITPAAMVVDNSLKDYTISSLNGDAIGLVGATSIVKTGTATLNLLSDNVHTGGFVVREGVLAFNAYGLALQGPVIMEGGSLKWLDDTRTDPSIRMQVRTHGQVGFDTQANNVVFTNTIGNDTRATLTKSGIGQLTLEGGSTMTGGLTIASGSMIVNGPIATTGTTDLHANTQLELNTKGRYTYQANTITLGEGSELRLQQTGGDRRYDFGSVTYRFGNAGAATIRTGSSLIWSHTNGAVIETNGGTKNAIVGDSPMQITTTQAPLTFNVADGSDPSDLDVNVAIQQSQGDLVKNGQGTLTLNAGNTISGQVLINQGTLAVGHETATNHKLRLNGGNLTLAENLSLNLDGGVTFASNDNATIRAAAGKASIKVYDVNSPDINVLAGVNAHVESSVDLLTSVYGFRFDTEGSLTVDGVIAGTGCAGGIINAGTMVGNDSTAVWKRGSGQVTLTGASTFTGGSNHTAVFSLQNGSVVLAGGNDRLPSNSALYLGATNNTSGKLVLNGIQQTLTGLQSVGSGNGNQIVSGSASQSTLTIQNSKNYTFNGQIGGSTEVECQIALVKSGTGELTLSGALQHHGGTTIHQGRLTVNQNTLNDQSTVTIDANAELNLTHTDTDVVKELYVGGVKQASGTYKAPGAEGVGTELPGLVGTGKLKVTNGEASVNDYDSWANEYGLTGDDALATADPDGDGFTNEQEYLFGTHPAEQTGSLITSETTPEGIVIRWLERVGGPTYQVLESQTLQQDWQTTNQPSVNDGEAVGNYQPKMLVAPIDQTRKFFRVEGQTNANP